MPSGLMYALGARPHITRGGYYALDNCCDTGNSVAARVGEQLHHGRVYSHPADTCSYSGGGQYLSGAGIRVDSWRTLARLTM